MVEFQWCGSNVDLLSSYSAHFSCPQTKMRAVKMRTSWHGRVSRSSRSRWSTPRTDDGLAEKERRRWPSRKREIGCGKQTIMETSHHWVVWGWQRHRNIQRIDKAMEFYHYTWPLIVSDNVTVRLKHLKETPRSSDYCEKKI